MSDLPSGAPGLEVGPIEPTTIARDLRLDPAKAGLVSSNAADRVAPDKPGFRTGLPPITSGYHPALDNAHVQGDDQTSPDVSSAPR